MKIGITADNHLTTRQENPARFSALEDILQRCEEVGVDLLVIAGDLFDQTNPNYADFETSYQEHRPEGLHTAIIPGNHDLGLTEKALAADGINVYTKPELVSYAEEGGPSLLFLPFQEGSTLGEEIAPFADQLPSQSWLLFGHGDWTGGTKYPDPYEPGVYMPLTKGDLEIYQPRKAFLGHIHRPYDSEKLHYPGSPCPLNITETGLRRFLLYDTESGEVSPQTVNSPLLYFQETFLILPLEDEVSTLQEQISRRIQVWNLPEGWEDKVQIRVAAVGTTRDRAAIKETLLDGFQRFRFYEGQGPDLSDLTHGSDPDRAQIARGVREWVNNLEWPSGPEEPRAEDILREALKVIYGR